MNHQYGDGVEILMQGEIMSMMIKELVVHLSLSYKNQTVSTRKVMTTALWDQNTQILVDFLYHSKC